MTRNVRFTIRNLFALLVLGAATFGLAACNLPPAPPPEPVMCIQDGSPQAAVCSAFADFGQNVVDQAFRVVACESGWNPMAVNPNGHYGLFQLHAGVVAIYQYGGDFLDANQNAQAARDLWVSRGRSWNAWSCRP